MILQQMLVPLTSVQTKKHKLSMIRFTPRALQPLVNCAIFLRNTSRHLDLTHPYVVKLCYAIAGVVAVVGAISVYIAMNNEEQDVKKKIMMVVGACIFLVAAAQALPLFFGL